MGTRFTQKASGSMFFVLCSLFSRSVIVLSTPFMLYSDRPHEKRNLWILDL